VACRLGATFLSRAAQRDVITSPGRWLKLCPETDIPKVDLSRRLEHRKLQKPFWGSLSRKIERLPGHYLGHLTGLVEVVEKKKLSDELWTDEHIRAGSMCPPRHRMDSSRGADPRCLCVSAVSRLATEAFRIDPDVTCYMNRISSSR